MNRRVAVWLGVASIPWVCACGGSSEAPRVELAVVADPSGVAPVTNDLGYTIELTEARAAVENFAFTVAGEAHMASLWRRLSELVVPPAYAHPGHAQEGDVTGELRGRFILDWAPHRDAELGTATVLAGVYKSANFTFARATEGDGVASDDGLLGHTALLRGRATKAATSVEFVARIDSPEGRELIGAPFELEVDEGTRERLGVRLVTRDSVEGDTLFDALDFAALDADGDGHVVLEEGASDVAIVDAYNRLRRTFQTHDHFDIKPSPPK